MIVIGADKMSSIINYKDRNTCPIFGDGAAAVLLEPSTEGYGVQDAILHSDGGGGQHLYMKAGRLGLSGHARNRRKQLALRLSGRTGRIQSRRIEHGGYVGRNHGTQ